MSWLVDATGEASALRIMTEIERLQQELDIANESIDDKLDKLEEAGLDVAGLTKALDGARQRIASLEKEVGQLHYPANDNSRYMDALKRLDDTRSQLNTKDKEIKELRRTIQSQKEEIISIRSEKKRAHVQYLESQGITSKLVLDIEHLQTEAMQIGRSLQELQVDRNGLAPLYKRKLAKLEERRELNDEQFMMLNRLNQYGKQFAGDEEK